MAYVSLVRLVLADNDEDALALIELDLRLEGHEIVGLAADGDAAVTRCAASQPDVLVVDHRMPPGPDGLAVARRVLAQGTVGRVVIYSNYRAPALLAEADALGVRWLLKGDLAELRRALLA